jgi:hypothetical protein
MRSFSNSPRAWLAALAALTLSAACGDDSTKTAADGGSGKPTIDTPDNASGNDAGERGDEKDGAVSQPPVTPTFDAGVDADGSTEDGTVPTTDDAATSDGAVSNTKPLPSNGDRLSLCYAKSDCNGDDLVCYLPDSARPGYCTDDCATDKDCQPLGGLAASCSPDGFCRIDCAGDKGAGDGPCPADMVCRNVTAANPLLSSFRCTYPDGGGKRTVGSYERCERGHGDADCKAATDGCYAPTLDLAGILGPGYCAPACTDATRCGATPAGTTAVSACSLTGRCELDCSQAGKGNCPSGMNCVNIAQGQLAPAVMRCRFID